MTDNIFGELHAKLSWHGQIETAKVKRCLIFPPEKYTSYMSPKLRWCLHDTGMNFIPERLAWFVSRLHGRSHSGVKML